MPASSLVFDSWALLSFLEDEPLATQVEQLIVDAKESEAQLLVSVVNAGEVWYSLARTRSEGQADRAIAEIRRLGFEFVAVDWEQTRIAALFKSRGKLAYADCFAAALAKLRKIAVVTGDPEFKQLEGQVKIRWMKIQ